MASITTILWDVGGVLLTNGWDHQERGSVLAQFGLNHDDFEQRHEWPNDAWEKGQITVEEYLDKTVFYQPRSFTYADFFTAMKAQSQVLKDSALGIIASLAASETITLGMLNNEARELNDYRIRHFRLHDYFDVFLSSCYLALRKPDPRIFRLALNVLQEEPESVAFVDDRQGNVDGANSVGIRGIRYEGPEQLKAEFERLGISTDAEAISR